MKTRLIFWTSILCFAGFLLAECSITDITVHQRWPWNGLVDITYQVVCDETDSSGKPLPLRLEFSGYDALRQVEIPMTTLSGDGVDQFITAGGPYTITWDAKTDSPNFATEYFRVKIKAFREGTPEPLTVSSVEIQGEGTIGGSAAIPYSLLVTWSNGSQTTVNPVWSITSGGAYASVDYATGLVTPKNSTGSDQTAELTATCEINGTAYTVKATLTIRSPQAYLVVNLEDGSHYYTGVAPDLTNATCRTTELWLRRIPAGTFAMGSPDDEIGRYSNEELHQVTLTQDYYIGVFEVTQRQWQLLMETTPSFCQGGNDAATRPVECVSYDMIRGSNLESTSFLGRLQEMTGLAFDLPTEAQWENACRAGTATALNTGKDLTSTDKDDNLDEVGRYWSNGGSSYSQIGDSSSGTAVAGNYLPNAWGLYDMHGNAWEWCLDWYAEKLGTAAVTDPKGPESGIYRLLRGGSWLIGAQDCRAATRSYYLPSANGFFGLRVTCLALP